ncbi:MAG: tRNA (adenosine(37)-N6)-threonylcarbamoyltransferase complex transferase subunit TsaD [Planctomycetota bacterium]
MLILGIETSCDETAAAVVRDGRRVLSSRVASQDDLHARFGGVVPEIACRAHLEVIPFVVGDALAEAGVAPGDLDAVAVVNGPGLVGSLLIGLTAAKTYAWLHGLPLVAVNHVAAHVYAAHLLPGELEYPTVGLIASGGHTSLCHASSPAEIDYLGGTIDDAAGEAFDKVAHILGLGYPGGPAVQNAAERGNPSKIDFPRSMLGPGSLDFSFSGLKTAVLYHVCGKDGKERDASALGGREIADVAASFQEAVVDVLVKKSVAACVQRACRRLVIGGGVAANTRLREKLARAAKHEAIELHVPEFRYCTDNAAMVAGLGEHLLRAGRTADLDLDAVPQLSDLK